MPGTQNEKAQIVTESNSNAWIGPVVLFVFFLLCRLSRLAQEAFKHVSDAEQRPVFVLAGFTVAAIPSLML